MKTLNEIINKLTTLELELIDIKNKNRTGLEYDYAIENIIDDFGEEISDVLKELRWCIKCSESIEQKGGDNDKAIDN